MSVLGRDVRTGDDLLRGLRYAEPCAHLDRVNGTARLRPLLRRSGLRADVLEGEELRPGLPLTTEV